MITDILRAAVLASEAHITQRRKYTNEPYINHPMRVASMVAGLFPEDHEAICAAILHDVVEDTEITEQMLRCAFSGRTVDLVMQATKKSKPDDGTREKRKEIDRRHYSCGSPTGQTLKVLDMTDNSKDIADRDPEFAKVYIPELRALLDVLTSAHKDARQRLLLLLDEQERRLAG